MPSEIFGKIGERSIYQGALVTLATGTFSAPDGSSFQRDIVHHPGAVSAVPLLEDSGEVVMVRQYRAAIDAELLEIPAGKRDVAGEPPAETARRELMEEIGMRPGRLEWLGEFYNSPGFSDEYSYVYLALDLEPTESAVQEIEEQHMSVERIPLLAVPELIRGRQIVDAKSIIGLTLALHARR